MDLKQTAVYKKSGEIYRKRKVFISLNSLGVFTSVLGMICCVAIIFGSYMANSQVNTQTVVAQDKITEQIDNADEILQNLIDKINSIELPEQIKTEIESASTNTIERLDNLKVAMDVLNFGGQLDPQIEKLDIVIDGLEKIQDVSDDFEKAKQIPIARIEKLQDRLSQARDRVTTTGRNLRLITHWAFISGSIIAIILIAGEWSLFSRCLANLKSTFRKKKPVTA